MNGVAGIYKGCGVQSANINYCSLLANVGQCYSCSTDNCNVQNNPSAAVSASRSCYQSTCVSPFTSCSTTSISCPSGVVSCYVSVFDGLIFEPSYFNQPNKTLHFCFKFQRAIPKLF
jgi:hypothetical protein